MRGRSLYLSNCIGNASTDAAAAGVPRERQPARLTLCCCCCPFCTEKAAPSLPAFAQGPWMWWRAPRRALHVGTRRRCPRPMRTRVRRPAGREVRVPATRPILPLSVRPRSRLPVMPRVGTLLRPRQTLRAGRCTLDRPPEPSESTLTCIPRKRLSLVPGTYPFWQVGDLPG